MWYRSLKCHVLERKTRQRQFPTDWIISHTQYSGVCFSDIFQEDEDVRIRSSFSLAKLFSPLCQLYTTRAVMSPFFLNFGLLEAGKFLLETRGYRMTTLYIFVYVHLPPACARASENNSCDL